MPTEILFRQLPTAASADTVQIHFNDKPLAVPAGSSVAAALLLAGVQRFRGAAVSGVARAPYCMMGVCFECLVEIDGEPSVQSCLVTVRDGMVVRAQQVAPAVTADSSGQAEVEHVG